MPKPWAHRSPQRYDRGDEPETAVSLALGEPNAALVAAAWRKQLEVAIEERRGTPFWKKRRKKTMEGNRDQLNLSSFRVDIHGPPVQLGLQTLSSNLGWQDMCQPYDWKTKPSTVWKGFHYFVSTIIYLYLVPIIPIWYRPYLQHFYPGSGISTCQDLEEFFLKWHARHPLKIRYFEEKS